MNVTTHRVFIGRKLGDQRFELNGAGRVTYLIPETVVDECVQSYLDSEQCEAVLAEVEPGLEAGAPCYVATRVRELKPSPEDYERYRLILERFKRAGVAVEAPASARLADPDFPFWDPFSTIRRRFLVTQATFPTSWWDDDPERGVQEMVALIAELKIRGRFPRARILKEALSDLWDSSATDTDDARDRLCGDLVAAANVLLEKAGGLCRFCGPFVHDGDPTWIYFAAAGYEALLREGLLEPWLGRVRDVVEYRRPPDWGEIDPDC
jgi:hypothetical protein